MRKPNKCLEPDSITKYSSKSKKFILDLIKDKGPFWPKHIPLVVKYGGMLADKLGADKEALEIAAWMHDIAKIYGKPEKHHITGAEEAKRLLLEWGCDESKAQQVKDIILAHASSGGVEAKTVEQKILKSADGMAQFDSLELWFWSAYKKGMTPEEARKDVYDKIDKFWNKMMPEAKKMMKQKYDAVRLLLA